MGHFYQVENLFISEEYDLKKITQPIANCAEGAAFLVDDDCTPFRFLLDARRPPRGNQRKQCTEILST